jgi:hypothetical protein
VCACVYVHTHTDAYIHTYKSPLESLKLKYANLIGEKVGWLCVCLCICAHTYIHTDIHTFKSPLESLKLKHANLIGLIIYLLVCVCVHEHAHTHTNTYIHGTYTMHAHIYTYTHILNLIPRANFISIYCLQNDKKVPWHSVQPYLIH